MVFIIIILYIFSEVPEGYTEDVLEANDIETVVTTWEYSTPNAAPYIRDMIKLMPNTCIRDCNGRPVAWQITYHWDESGILYTDPAHRVKGLAKAIISRMTRKQWKRRTHVFGLTEGTNVASLKLHKSMGFVDEAPMMLLHCRSSP